MALTLARIGFQDFIQQNLTFVFGT